MKKMVLIAPLRNPALFAPVTRYFSEGYSVTTADPGDIDTLRKATPDADVVYSMGGTTPLVALSAKRGDALLVAALQGDELLSDDFKNVNWRNVDGVVLAGAHLQELSHELWPSLLDRLPVHVSANVADTPELPVRFAGRNFAYMSPLSKGEGLDLLLLCFQAASQKRPGALLHIAGRFQDPSLEALFH